MTRRILVTSALPYANGPIHIGHLVEYIQTDIWVRFQKLIGNRCLYVCADDTHGTAIMLRAKRENRSEEAVIEEMNANHQRDFAGFSIDFDHYDSTHSEANRAICHEFWQALRDADLVTERNVDQLYDPEAETFLADRFVRGTCPVSGHENQPGDNCVCGATYSPIELIDPRSTLSGATPELRSATHLFVQLEKLRGFLDRMGRHQRCPAKRNCELSQRLLPRRGQGTSRTGTSADRHPISDSKSLTRRATTGTSGSTLRSVTSPAPHNGAKPTANHSMIGGATKKWRSTTSLGKTSLTSTRCFGPAC